jgi:hypothetical protein
MDFIEDLKTMSGRQDWETDEESEGKGSRSAEMMGAEGGRIWFQLPNLADADVESVPDLGFMSFYVLYADGLNHGDRSGPILELS